MGGHAREGRILRMVDVVVRVVVVGYYATGAAAVNWAVASPLQNVVRDWLLAGLLVLCVFRPFRGPIGLVALGFLAAFDIWQFATGRAFELVWLTDLSVMRVATIVVAFDLGRWAGGLIVKRRRIAAAVVVLAGLFLVALEPQTIGVLQSGAVSFDLGNLARGFAVFFREPEGRAAGMAIAFSVAVTAGSAAYVSSLMLDAAAQRRWALHGVRSAIKLTVRRLETGGPVDTSSLTTAVDNMRQTHQRLMAHGSGDIVPPQFRRAVAGISGLVALASVGATGLPTSVSDVPGLMGLAAIPLAVIAGFGVGPGTAPAYLLAPVFVVTAAAVGLREERAVFGAVASLVLLVANNLRGGWKLGVFSVLTLTTIWAVAWATPAEVAAVLGTFHRGVGDLLPTWGAIVLGLGAGRAAARRQWGRAGAALVVLLPGVALWWHLVTFGRPFPGYAVVSVEGAANFLRLAFLFVGDVGPAVLMLAGFFAALGSRWVALETARGLYMGGVRAHGSEVASMEFALRRVRDARRAEDAALARAEAARMLLLCDAGLCRLEEVAEGTPAEQLGRVAAEVSEATDVDIHLDIGPRFGDGLDERQGEALVELILALVLNAAAAARPSDGMVSVRGTVEKDTAQVVVDDDGPGWDGPSGDETEGSYATFVPKLLEVLNGTFTVARRKGGTGTSVTVTVPDVRGATAS